MLKSHAGTNGSRVLSCNHTDTTGRVWPKGTVYRPVSRGNVTVDRDGRDVTTCHQVVVIESSHYQDVLEDGFGQQITFESE